MSNATKQAAEALRQVLNSRASDYADVAFPGWHKRAHEALAALEAEDAHDPDYAAKLIAGKPLPVITPVLEEREELGWLIETGDHKYWNGKKASADGFTGDPNDAVRFARFEDAERVLHWLMSDYRVFLVSRQHKWIGGMPKAKP